MKKAALLLSLAVFTLVLTSWEWKKNQHPSVQKADVIADGKIDKGEFDIYHYTVFQMLDFDPIFFGANQRRTSCQRY